MGDIVSAYERAFSAAGEVNDAIAGWDRALMELSVNLMRKRGAVRQPHANPRRVWVHLDTSKTACLITYQRERTMTITERLIASDLRLPAKWDQATDVWSARGGELVYILHSNATKQVKIGRTNGDLRIRWRNIENASGLTLQPIALMRVGSSARVEARLHDAFADWRGIGEWFVDGPIIKWLTTSQTKRTLRMPTRMETGIYNGWPE